MSIKGYRQLSEDEILLINDIKSKEKQLIEFIDSLEMDVDRRWLAIAKTHIEQGFMALVRSIARPE